MGPSVEVSPVESPNYVPSSPGGGGTATRPVTPKSVGGMGSEGHHPSTPVDDVDSEGTGHQQHSEDQATDNDVDSSERSMCRELWVFNIGIETESVGDADGMIELETGEFDADMVYRTGENASVPALAEVEFGLFGKAMLNVLERVLMSKGGTRIGDCFVFPSDCVGDELREQDSSLKSISIAIHLTVNNLMVHLNVALLRFRRLHWVDLIAPEGEPVSVILGPYGNSATLVPQSSVPTNLNNSTYELSLWSKFFGYTLLPSTTCPGIKPTLPVRLPDETPRQTFDAAIWNGGCDEGDYWRYTSYESRIAESVLKAFGESEKIVGVEDDAVGEVDTEADANTGGGTGKGSVMGPPGAKKGRKKSENGVVVSDIGNFARSPILKTQSPTDASAELDMDMSAFSLGTGGGSLSQDLDDLTMDMVGDADFDFFDSKPGGGDDFDFFDRKPTMVSATTPGPAHDALMGSDPFSPALSQSFPSPAPPAYPATAYSPYAEGASPVFVDHPTPREHMTPRAVAESPAAWEGDLGGSSTVPPAVFTPGSPAKTPGVYAGDAVGEKFTVAECEPVRIVVEELEESDGDVDDGCLRLPREWRALKIASGIDGESWEEIGQRYSAGGLWGYVPDVLGKRKRKWWSAQSASSDESSSSGASSVEDSKDDDLISEAVDETDTNQDTSPSVITGVDAALQYQHRCSPPIDTNRTAPIGTDDSPGPHALLETALPSWRTDMPMFDLAVSLLVESSAFGRGEDTDDPGVSSYGGNFRDADETVPAIAEAIGEDEATSRFGEDKDKGGAIGIRVKGPLSIRQLYDLQDEDRGPSKYGKLSLRKKRRSVTTSPLALLQRSRILLRRRASAVNGEEQEQTIAMSPAAVKMWPKIKIVPVSGRRDIVVKVLAPPAVVGDTEQWTRDFKEAWEGQGFGKCSATVHAVELLSQMSGETGEQVRMRSYKAALDGIAIQVPPNFLSPSTSNSHVILLLLNPLPMKASSAFSLHYLAAQYLQQVASQNQLSLETLSTFLTADILPLSDILHPPVVALLPLCLTLYSRLRTSMRGVTLRSMPYTLAPQIPPRPAFSATRAAVGVPSLCMEPERVLHIAYVLRDRWCVRGE
ncbi:hypothetical protein HK104_008694 [Borealophlyctis nickersoniae]|nr:hypothetical protein HK104_008694 [Borealophlyctis nickersoniae]